MKYLVTFNKGELVRWLGHLDMLRTFERAIRRAELPIAFTAGFNPRERIAFASALGVGVTGEAELATIELTEPLEASDLVTRLNDRLPPGIRLSRAQAIPDAGSRDLLNSFDRAELRVTCDAPGGTSEAALTEAARSLLESAELVIEREREGRRKRLDIRPRIHSVELLEPPQPAPGGGCRAEFRFVLALGEEGSARPVEIVDLMAREVPGLALRRVHRVGLISPSPEAAV